MLSENADAEMPSPAFLRLFQETLAEPGTLAATRLRDFLEALPAAVYTTDAAGRITFYNEPAAVLWGCRPELGRSEWCGSWRLYWPDGRSLPHDQCPMAVALKERRPVRGAEAVAERPDGSRIPFIPFPTPLFDDTGDLVGAVNVLVDISERKKAEEQLRLMAREIDHRSRNLAATVHALIDMTTADSVPEYVVRLKGRLSALSRTQSLLAEGRWSGADLRRLVEVETAPYRADDATRVRATGPRVLLPESMAQALSMTLHEMGTNAVKHGALSVPAGFVALDWRHGPDGTLFLRWAEYGGPPVQPPARRGFGTRLIETAIRGQLGGDLRVAWNPAGLICNISVPMTP